METWRPMASGLESDVWPSSQRPVVIAGEEVFGFEETSGKSS